MLYVTTRDLKDVYTPRHTLCRDRDANGGFYIPFRNVQFSGEDILALKEKTFGECIADILNMFFSTKMTGWEVDFAIGRKPVRFVSMSHKILVGELYNNPGNSFRWIVKKLRDIVVPPGEVPENPSQWTLIAVRIAVLFGIFGELQRLGLAGQNRTIDISLAIDDFLGPMAVFYAKEMGLPIGNIVFGCNENSGMWDILHHGNLHAAGSRIRTDTPDCDHKTPSGLERLLHERLGRSEVKRYVDSISRNGVYSISEEARCILSEGFFGAVISQKRRTNVIRNVYGTNSYLLDSYGALAYGALQDYRAIHSEVGPALILADFCPGTVSHSTKQAEE